MKIKREIISIWGITTSTSIVEGTTLKKLSEKYPDAKVETINGTIKNVVLIRDGFNIYYSKK